MITKNFSAKLRLSAVLLTIFVVISYSAPPAAAHPGRTASDGCHNDRKAGKRHCHSAKKTKTSQRSNLNTSKKTRAGSVYYKNCTAARAAGAAPIRRGQAGYARHLDRDNDGLACE